MDTIQKEQFIKLTHFLGEVLGSRYEVVFHIIEDEGSKIAAIANSHISGRTLSSPLSAFASKLVQEKEYLKKDYLCDYKAMAKDNVLRGSTFFIKEGENLVGIFCVNHDTSDMREAISKIIDIEKLGDMLASKESKETKDSAVVGNTAIEILSHSIEEILALSVDLNDLQSGATLTTKQKQDCITNLYNKGIFNIKGTIPIIANMLKMSEPSVYRYLQNLKLKAK